MAEHEERPEGAEEDVEGHGLKEVIATGAAAGALLAGAGAAQAANSSPDRFAAAPQPDARAVSNPAVNQDPSGGGTGARFVLPEPGAAGGQVAPGDPGLGAAKPAAKKKAAPKKHNRK